MATNGDFGFTVQKIICDIYGLTPNEAATRQFDAAYTEQYYDDIVPIIKSIFDNLGGVPTECTTYTPSTNSKETLSPHNFILSNKMTLSIRTSKGSNKIAPRVIGQSGITTFNNHFADIIGYEVADKEDIKKAVIENIDKMLPLFLDYLFVSDYTVWIYEIDNKFLFEIFDRNMIIDISTDIDDYSFTRGLDLWTESTTLKYQNISLAEIQIHKNRTFKFRFDMKKLLPFISAQLKTTETLGITAEAAICTEFNIEIPQNYKNRIAWRLIPELKPVIVEAFHHLPTAIKSTGAEQGERGENSKCSYDFVLEGEKTLSLKTNTGKMICPPEVGQPGAETCYYYFGHLIDDKKITEENFKELVLSKIDQMLPIYVKHLFDSDYMLWIYQRKGQFNYKIFNSDYAKNIVWDYRKITFTKQTVSDWNESNTLKYDGVSIGEFQVHKARSCFKFRFNMENLEKIITGEQKFKNNGEG